MLIFPPRPSEFKFNEAKSPRLRIVSFSDAVRTIVVRGVTKTGLIHDTYSTTSDRLTQERIIPLTEIPLTIHVETSTTATQRGQLYVQVQLQFASVPATMLAADYLTTGSPLAWPGQPPRAATEGRGALLGLVFSNPAAGAEFLFTVPANTLWQIRGMRYTLVTSATAATRESTVYFEYSTIAQVAFARPTTTQAASLTYQYFFNDYTIVPALFGTAVAGQLPQLILPDLSVFGTNTTNQQAADQYQSALITVEQWLNP